MIIALIICIGNLTTGKLVNISEEIANSYHLASSFSFLYRVFVFLAPIIITYKAYGLIPIHIFHVLVLFFV